MTIKVLVGTGLALLTLTVFGADRGNSGQTQLSDNALDEVVVTARRRDERIVDVPVAISVLTEATLRNNLVYNVQDISNNTPNVLIAPSPFGSGDPSLTIRGQHQTENLITQDPSVGIYFADVIQQRPFGANATLYDIASVQILKGPQGTLFGRNTTGGAMLITPYAPVLGKFDGDATVGSGNYDRRTVTAEVNIPLAETLALRLAGQTNDHSGYVRNLFNGQDFNDEHDRSGRVSLLYQPSETFQNESVYQIFRSHDAGEAWRLLHLSPKGFAYLLSPTTLPQMQATLQHIQGAGFWTVENDNTVGDHVDAQMFTNTTKWKIGGVTLKNIAGYRYVNALGSADYDGSAVTVGPFPAGNRLPLFNTYDTLLSNQESDEFQVLGDALDERLNWIIGAYYFRERGDDNQHSVLIPSDVRVNHGVGTNQSESLFAQGTFKFPGIDKLSLTAGIRQTYDQRELVSENLEKLLAVPDFGCRLQDSAGAPLAPCSRTTLYNNDSPTWTLSLDYKLTPDSLVYLATRHGYRSGGLQIRANTPSDPQTYKPETVNDFELGTKWASSVLGMPVNVNADVYYERYNDIQRVETITNPTTLETATVILNAGRAIIGGAEVDFTIRPTQGLEFSGFYGVTNPRYSVFNGYAGGPLHDGSGNPASTDQFAYVPHSTYGATIRYTLPLAEHIGVVSVQGNYYHQDLFYDSDLNDSNGFVPGYHLVNLTVDWEKVMSSPFDIRFFVKNLTNQQYFTGGQSLLALGYGSEVLGAPRIYGVDLSYHF